MSKKRKENECLPSNETVKFTYDTVMTDIETGEIFEFEAGGVYIPPKADTRDDIQRKCCLHGNEKFKGKNGDYHLTSELRGNFFTVLCSDFNSFFDNVSDNALPKIIYLASFVDINNCICYDGKWVAKCRKSIPMQKQDIQKVLSISKPTFRTFMNEVSELNILTQREEAYYLADDLFRFCNSRNVDRKKVRMVKVFRHAVRDVYSNIDSRSAKNLSHLFRLIPFVNMKYNILCHNPWEQFLDAIIPLDECDICKIAGLTNGNRKRLIDSLLFLDFADKQGTRRKIVISSERGFVVNPQFFSGYIAENEMSELVKKFVK